ncbi:MAG: SpoIIE family protein phosphatase [Brumimicrobium sp.]
MKAHIDKVVKHIALLTLVLSAIIMGYIVYELSITKANIAKSLVDKALDQTHHELEDFFHPVKNQLKTSTIQAQMKPINDFTLVDYNKLFVPIIQNYPQISSLGIATNEGFEHDIILEGNDEWITREIHIDKTGFQEFWTAYKVDGNRVQIDSSWTSLAEHDPRSRPWYIGADRKQNELYWTSPYVFNTNNKAGITVSSSWTDPFDDSLHVILAYDLTLESISQFTKEIRPTSNGEVMITTGDKTFVVGAPRRIDKNDNRIEFLSLADSIDQHELRQVLEHQETGEAFSFESKGQNWWGICERFELNKDQSFMIIVALPENDFLAEINESQKLMSGGFFGILLLTFLIMRSHNKQVKNQRLLKEKNNEITHQSKLLSTKNREIMDSINYAKRIQTAILPPDRLVQKYLDNSFVLYLPKDVVAGDFYWMQSIINDKNESVILFAAADCTGHGVPGAMVSVMCHNALNRSVKEFGLLKPNEILGKTRELVLEEFSKSEDDMTDGMDISLCSLNTTTNELLWAGANNPLWIFKKEATKDSIIEIKPDKQPVGKHPEEKPFTLHKLKLDVGDLIYIFTDGLQDQFGGDEFKKFKPLRFRNLILEIHHLSLEEQRLKVLQTFKEWKKDEDQVDDICIIGVRI